MTLGNAAAAHVRIIVWRLDCQHLADPDPAEMAGLWRRNARPRMARAAGVRPVRVRGRWIWSSPERSGASSLP
jgi:hypothetical protein